MVDDIQNHFRHYIEKAPAGKLALLAVNDWLGFCDDISKDDYLLMANTCYLFGEYEKARELIHKADINEAWALDVKNSYAMKNFPRAKFLTENGLQKHAQYVSEDEIIEAVDIYTGLSASKSQAVDRLLGLAQGKGRDYLLSLKCQNVSQMIKQLVTVIYILNTLTADFLQMPLQISFSQKLRLATMKMLKNRT